MTNTFSQIVPSQSHRRIRVIPVLTVDSRGRLVKTVRFKARAYIGDPINAVKVFNVKEVDELILLDIDATTENRPPRYSAIEDVVSEAFMPVAYGGGIRSMEDVLKLHECGVEKTVLSSALEDGFGLIREVGKRFGSQAVTVSLPIGRSLFGRRKVKTRSGAKALKEDAVALARLAEDNGAGEILVNSIDLDGTWAGYDLAFIKEISEAVSVPVVACGGAGSVDDLAAAIKAGASAVAASSLFIYQAKGSGVLISYPPPMQLSADGRRSTN